MDKPMSLIEALEYASKATTTHLHYLDECGQCAESDDFVVALAVVDDHLEDLKGREHFKDTLMNLLKKKHENK